jgi:hypothetical protein
MGYDTEGHKPIYEALLKLSGARLRQAWTNNDNVTVRERFTETGSAVLFIGNYFNEAQSGRVFYTHPESGDEIPVPYSSETLSWPALYGVLSPVCLEIEDGLKILHTTSDILEIMKSGQQVEIKLYGDSDLEGEIVFEGANLDRIKSAMIDGVDLNIVRDGKRVIYNYCHKFQHALILILLIE